MSAMAPASWDGTTRVSRQANGHHESTCDGGRATGCLPFRFCDTKIRSICNAKQTGNFVSFFLLQYNKVKDDSFLSTPN